MTAKAFQRFYRAKEFTASSHYLMAWVKKQKRFHCDKGNGEKLRALFRGSVTRLFVFPLVFPSIFLSSGDEKKESIRKRRKSINKNNKKINLVKILCRGIHATTERWFCLPCQFEFGSENSKKFTHNLSRVNKPPHLTDGAESKLNFKRNFTAANTTRWPFLITNWTSTELEEENFPRTQNTERCKISGRKSFLLSRRKWKTFSSCSFTMDSVTWNSFSSSLRFSMLLLRVLMYLRLFLGCLSFYLFRSCSTCRMDGEE